MYIRQTLGFGDLNLLEVAGSGVSWRIRCSKSAGSMAGDLRGHDNDSIVLSRFDPRGWIWWTGLPLYIEQDDLHVNQRQERAR